MFTGIIQAVGKVARISAAGSSADLVIKAEGFWGDVKIGDSVAVDGVCLTAARKSGAECAFDVSKETLDRSIIGKYKKGAGVNLEKALRASDRLGGHIVQGHVDGVGRCAGRRRSGEYVELDFALPAGLARYAVEKGSVAVNGVSLTIARVKGARITTALIPHTLDATNLSSLAANSRVNLECDIMAKYAEKLLAPLKGGG
ncbi:MAG: riboflavin synthase [Nitrospinae bacterium]|nr:riboflavin synthase [Nitrospinota bacterium]